MKINYDPKHLKSWHVCDSCGDKLFPHSDKSGWIGITVMEGKCPYCKQIKTLIPYADWGGYGD